MTHNNFKMRFVIPIGGKTKKWWQFWKSDGVTPSEAKETIDRLLSDYKKEVEWDNNSGDIQINLPLLDIEKDYYFSTPDESVDVEITINDNGNIIYNKYGKN